jgi:hypothetical protein
LGIQEAWMSETQFDKIMRTTMRDRTARVRRSIGLDQAVDPAARPIIPRLTGLSELAERHARKAGFQVDWANTRIQTIDNAIGTDPYALIDAGTRRASPAPRDAFEVVEEDEADEELDADPEIQALKDEINRVMGRGTRKRSTNDRRSYAADAGKCRECRIQDDGRPVDVVDAKPFIQEAIARLQKQLAEFS